MDNDWFEKLAKEFFEDTGEMAPGKDTREPLGRGQEIYIEELWRTWLKGRARGLEAADKNRVKPCGA